MTRDAATFARSCAVPPSLESASAHVLSLLEQADSSVVEISTGLGKDPGSAVRVLKLANSVFHGFAGQVATLDRAVQIIGLNQTRELVLQSSAERPEVPTIDRAEFWRHSFLCATAAGMLASECNHPDPERVFLGGLLHEIGRIAIAQHAPEQAAEVAARCARDSDLSLNIERQVLGFDHATLGAELLSHWQMPKSLANIIRWHHNPAKAPNPQLDVFLVHYADFITTVLEMGEGGETLVCPLAVPTLLKGMLLSEARLELFVEELQGHERASRRGYKALAMAQ